MDHAVRIPEMGVSKVSVSHLCPISHLWTAQVFDVPNDEAFVFQFHAEVYFDQEQQSYVLVDQGSQNGTVINGNRILQVSIFPLSCLTKNVGSWNPAVTVHFPAA